MLSYIHTLWNFVMVKHMYVSLWNTTYIVCTYECVTVECYSVYTSICMCDYGILYNQYTTSIMCCMTECNSSKCMYNCMHYLALLCAVN